VFLVADAGHAQADTAACTQTQADEAERSADRLGSWKDLYAAYTRFKQCDDGGIAEGYSDSVAKLMANHWPSLPKVLPLIRADPAFETWFISHLDETDDDADLAKIERLARTACPPQAQELCDRIHEQMKSYKCLPDYPASFACSARRD